MTKIKLAHYGALLLTTGLLFSACSLLPSSPPAAEQTETMEESPMMTPPSESTDIEAMQRDLDNVDILDEDFSQL